MESLKRPEPPVAKVAGSDPLGTPSAAAWAGWAALGRIGAEQTAAQTATATATAKRENRVARRCVRACWVTSTPMISST